MKLHKRPIVAATVALMTIAGLAGCGTDSTSGSASSSGSSSATIIWAVQSGQSDSYQAGVDRWNAAHPDQPIQLQLMPDADYKTKIRVALGANQGPDLIFSWGGGSLKDFIDAGYIDPLDSYVSQYPDLLSKFLPAVMTPVQFNNQTYGVPIANMQPVVVFYNKQVFSDASIQPADTWDNLMNSVIPTLNAQGVAPFTVAGQSQWPDLPFLEYLVDRVGGPQVFDNIANNVPNSWSDPSMIQALTMIQDMVKAKGVTSNFSSLAYETGAADALLYTNKAGMELMLASAYANMNKSAPDFVSSGNLAYTTFPAVTGGKGDTSNIVGNPSNYWSLNAKSTAAHKATAVQFLAEQVENTQWASEILGRNGLPPIAAAESMMTGDNMAFAKYCFDLVQQAGNFQMSWDQALSADQGSALLTQLDQLFLLQTTPQDFADAMNKTITS